MRYITYALMGTLIEHSRTRQGCKKLLTCWKGMYLIIHVLEAGKVDHSSTEGRCSR